MVSDIASSPPKLKSLSRNGPDPHQVLPKSNPDKESPMDSSQPLVIDELFMTLVLETKVGVDLEAMAEGVSTVDALADIWRHFAATPFGIYFSGKELKRLIKQKGNYHMPVSRRPRKSHRDRSRYCFQGYRGSIMVARECLLTGRSETSPNLQNIPEVQP